MKGMTLKEAMGIAQNAVRKHFEERKIAGDVLSRLGYGAQQVDDVWLVEVVLHPVAPEDADKGMERDLDWPRPKTILRVRVDMASGSADVTDVTP